MAPKSDLVLTTVNDGIAEIRFNRPDKLNALSTGLASEFSEAVARVVPDPTVAVIVLSAEGRSFMAGGDLGEFLGSVDRVETSRQLIDHIVPALNALENAPQITISSIKGAVAGGGMGLALCADLVVAADDTRLSTAYARIAMCPDTGMTYMLPRLVGLHKALELALLADFIDAEEAKRLGLVSRVVPIAGLEEETRKLARRIAAGGMASNAATKSLIRTSANRSFREQLTIERERFLECVATPDLEEGVRAFFEKRPPVFARRRFD